jgi:hypothetical protein
VSTKSRPVIEVLTLGQISTDTGKASTAQKSFEQIDLIFATPHLAFQQGRYIGRHALIGFGRFHPQPIGDILRQRDG